MSIPASEDASAYEGAMKKRDRSFQKQSLASNPSEEIVKPGTTKSGWGEGGNSARQPEEATTTDFEYKFDENDDSDIPMPDKNQDEDLSTQVAAPPKLASKVQSIKELDNATRFNLPSTKDTGVDISLLTKMMSSQDQVKEKDEAWEFDSMFVTVTSELQQELEEEENKKKEDEKEDSEEGPQNGVNSTK